MKHPYHFENKTFPNLVKSWLNKNMPVGYIWIQELLINLFGLLCGTILALFSFQWKLMVSLYSHDPIIIPSFHEVLGKSLYPLLLITIAQLIWIGIHYYYHYTGLSKSIYIMKRLSNKMELHRRCIFIPVVTMIVIILVTCIVSGIDYQIYLKATSEILLTN